MKLVDRNIIITGATSGIGLALALLLAEHNHITVLARKSERSVALIAAIPAVRFIPTDLANAQSVEAAGLTLANETQPHGLINCAAIQYTPLYTDSDFVRATISREIAINLTSVCELTALVLPALLAKDEAFIMNVNSGLGLVPKTESAVYCATKGGLNIFTQALRNQLRSTNICVQQAFLPLVDTPMTSGRGTGKLEAGDVAARILTAIEQGDEDTYVGKVKLLRAINFLAPPLARWIMRRQ